MRRGGWGARARCEETPAAEDWRGVRAAAGPVGQIPSQAPLPEVNRHERRIKLTWEDSGIM